MTDWTQAQKEAISERNKDLLISAGAGSGKTAVLTERIIRLIEEDKINADRFLVLTFTKAAAAEMKARIRKALYKKIKIGENKEFYYAQLNLLEKAQISTIHSFCLNVVKKFYYVIDIDPASSLLSDAENKILKQEALEQLFEMKYLQQDEAFIPLADTYSPGNDDERIKEIILYFYTFIMNRPDPWSWLADACEKFNFGEEDFIKLPAVDFLMHYSAEYIEEAMFNIKEAISLCRIYDSDGKRTQYLIRMEEDVLLLKSSLEISFEAFINEINAITFTRYDMRSSCEKSDEIKMLKDNAKDAIDELKSTFGFSFCSYRAQMQQLYPIMTKLADTVKEFAEIYSILKKEKITMDYNDLEHHCLLIMQNELAAEQIKAQYDLVFVDEYQDTNSIQEAIIGKVTKENALFTVGDIKQSIYRFREAEPDIFMKRYHLYKNQQSDNAKLIFLNTNFRTSPIIIDGINEIFSKIMYSQTGGVDYYPEEMLVAGIQSKDMKKPEIHIVENSDADNRGNFDADNLMEEILNFKKQEAEAAYTAELIKKLLTEDIYDESIGSNRKIRPNDIAIICRSMRASANYYIEALKEIGISALSDKSGSYYDEMEVALIMDLLKVIDNAKNDIPLTGIMRSFLYHFNADEMLKVRLFSKQSTYYHEALTQYAQNGEDETLKFKVNNMLNNISDFREMSKHTSIEKLLRKIYSSTRIATFMGALAKGSQRQQNLKYLLKLASHYETTSFKGLYNFIQYVEKSKAHDSSFQINTQASNEETVKLLTVHKSKGLEFNVVILTGCANSFNLADTREDIILEKTLGICPIFYDMEKSYCCDTLAKTAAKKLIAQDTIAEEMRILYVAATRAKQRLIFTGMLQDGKTEKLLNEACAPLTTLAIRETNHYLGWMLKVVLSNENDIQNILSAEVYEKANYIIYKKKWTAQQNSHQNITLSIDEILPPSNKKSKNYDRIAQILSYTYPHKQASSIPSKLSVSSLKDADTLMIGEKVIALQDAPRFMKTTEKFTQAQIGTLVHSVLLHLNLKKINKNDIGNDVILQIKAMMEQGLFSEKEMNAVHVDLIVGFLQSEIGKLLLLADDLQKETPFIMKMKANDINQEWQNANETIMVQGIIDCWFEIDGKLILIDYKTDYVYDNDQLLSLKEKYRRQIELYDQALQIIIGRRADEKYLCFLSMKENILIE